MRLNITVAPSKADVAKKIINNEIPGIFDYASFISQEQDNVWITNDYDKFEAYTTLDDLVYDGLMWDFENAGIDVEEDVELLEIE